MDGALMCIPFQAGLWQLSVGSKDGFTVIFPGCTHVPVHLLPRKWTESHVGKADKHPTVPLNKTTLHLHRVAGRFSSSLIGSSAL